MSDCIFCKIVAGEIPSFKVYEDEDVLAFLDITQVTKGHTLVVPKKHCRNMLDMDDAASSTLFARIPKIARQLQTKLKAKGMNILNNNEEVAGQSVFHTHVHLLPRFDENDDLNITFHTHQPDMDTLGRLAQELYLGE